MEQTEKLITICGDFVGKRYANLFADIFFLRNRAVKAVATHTLRQRMLVLQTLAADFAAVCGLKCDYTANSNKQTEHKL